MWLENLSSLKCAQLLKISHGFRLTIIFGVMLTFSSGQPSAALPVDKVKVPPGFKIEIYTDKVPGARQMCLSPKGILYVGTHDESGSVYAVVDANKDGKVDSVKTIAKGLFMPNGVAWRKGSLFVAEVDKISRYDDIDDKLDHPPAPQVVKSDFAKETHHGWKYIRFGPDDLLYVPIGAPCNVCVRPEDPRFGSLSRMRADGSGFEIYAKGIRNTVGFDWQPKTHELWFTDNGRDMLGDNIPPDELNHAPRAGMNFGFPYRWGSNQIDPDWGSKDTKTNFVIPAKELGPHVASLGLRFYTGKMFPDEYLNQAFICEHGSWNRSTKFGYRVTLVTMKDNKPIDYKIFAEGWLQNGQAWGRPNDLCLMPDGSLLISDDMGGAIYRISYDTKSGANKNTIDGLKSAYPEKTSSGH